MADFIYLMETRLSPDQQRAVTLVTDVARAHEMNIFLTGGAVRDIISGFIIRDLDFSVQGNALKLQKDFEKAGAVTEATDEITRTLMLLLPGNVRAEVTSARSEKYDKPGKPAEITQGTIYDDMGRRDFTVNAMALSLNEGSRGLLLDPFNGVADIEAKVLRILHPYSFVEDPSRLIRATRFAARFHWPMEERTQQRFDSARENKYIEHISKSAIGHEIAQLAHEEDPLNVVRALEKEEFLKVLHPHWTTAKVDTNGLTQLMKTRQQIVDLGYTVDPSASVMHFLTAHLSDKDISDLRRQIPRKDLIEAWRDIEEHAKALAKRLQGKEAATPSRTWNLLSSARPEMILFLAVTARQQAVAQKIKNFFTKWRDVQKRIPLPEMTELLITPQLPEYPRIAREVFMLLLDGKLRSHTETLKFLKPFAPPPPPPPPPPRRGRGPKAASPMVAPIIEVPGKPVKGKGKKGGPPAPVVAPVTAAIAKAKPEAGAKSTAQAKAPKPSVKAPKPSRPAPKHAPKPGKKSKPSKKTKKR